MMMKRIVLIRHAESEANTAAAAKVSGQSNYSPLTPLGKQQAQALGKNLRGLIGDPGPIFSSTAVRTCETARIALSELQMPESVVCKSDALLEISMGTWEGADRKACYTPETLEAIDRDPFNFTAPGGESLREVEHRVTEFILQTVLPATKLNGPPTLVFSHGIAIKCFLRGILGAEPAMLRKIRADNTSVTEVIWSESGSYQGWIIKCVNDTTHLVLEGVEGRGKS